MFARFCIFSLILIGAATVLSVRAAGPGTHAPDRFTPDSARVANPDASARNQRLYDSIQSKTSRRAVPRMLYRMLFVKPVLDTTMSGRVTDESRLLEPYAGKTIGDITIERQQVFDPGGNRLERMANKTHMLTRDRVVRRDLLFRSGDKLDPQLIVRNKQLIRSRDYISDIDVTVLPDAVDSTRVNLLITTRDSWTVSVDGGWHSEGRTMVGLSDANIFGSGNKLKFMTNFSRKDFSYGGNMVEYEIPNLLGTFYTAEIGGGRDFYNSTLNMGLRKEFLKPTDYEIGLTYSDIARMTAENPAKIFGLYPRKGVIQPGSDADLVVIRPDSSHVIDAGTQKQYVDYNPYQGMVVSHKVRHVFLRGQKIIEDGAFKTDVPAGNYLLRNTLVR